MICALTLASCASLTSSSGAEARFCKVAKPIYWAQNDTDETLVQIKAYNDMGKRLCGWTGREDK